MASNSFPMMADLLPPARRGVAAVEHFTVSDHDARFHNLRCSFTPGSRNDLLEPGTFARLFVDGQLMMSDTEMERRTNWRVKHAAHGRVLIAGLGLGMIVHPLLANPSVSHVTVIEKYADVIALVGPSLPTVTDRLTVTEADIFAWAPPKGALWDVIYFDIWPDVCTDNLDEMTRLNRKFARRLNRQNPKAWMDAWRQDELRARRNEERRYGW